MSAVEEAVPDRDQLLAEAIRVLTAAARLTQVVLDREQGRRELPADWAEFVAEALAGAAANVGSLDAALAGRPGSWEADLVQRLVAGTVGWDGEYLLEHRTDPVHVVLRPLEALVDAGVDAAYDRAWEELEQRKETAWPADVDHEDLTTEQRAALEAAEQLQERLDRMREEDLDAYGTALAQAAQAAQAAAAGTGLRVPVYIELEGGLRSPDEETGEEDPVALRLIDQALAAVPVPGAAGPGQAPQPPLERLQAGDAGGTAS